MKTLTRLDLYYLMLFTHKNFLKENIYNCLLQLKATAYHYLLASGEACDTSEAIQRFDRRC